jgi:hypothetical protein
MKTPSEKISTSRLQSAAGYGILRAVPPKRVCEEAPAERKCANANDLTRSAVGGNAGASRRTGRLQHEEAPMQSNEKTAGKTANGGARCVAWSYAANAGLALGGAVLVAMCATEDMMHALTMGALLAAAGGCLALAMMIGASIGRGEVQNG